MMTKNELHILRSLVGACGHNSGNKAAFKRLSTKLMRELRGLLAVPDADIGYNAAGIACSGYEHHRVERY